MKYINADEFERDCMFDRNCEDMQDVIYKLRDYPPADVVEVETLKKNIEANLDEAKKLRDEHSSELIRAFQQGRMFGHECDLEMIKRRETE